MKGVLIVLLLGLVFGINTIWTNVEIYDSPIGTDYRIEIS